MDADYRRILRENLLALFKAKGLSIKSPPPVHIRAGVKKGERISPRSFQNWMSKRADASSPSLDAVAAIALAFDLQPWELLVPGLSLEDRPVLASGAAVEAEIRRRVEHEVNKQVAEKMLVVQRQVSALLVADEAQPLEPAASASPHPEAPSPRKSRRPR